MSHRRPSVSRGYRRHRDHHHRLFWRIYRHGLLLLVLVVVATIAAGWIGGSQFPVKRQARQLALRVAADLGPGPVDRARLQRRVDDIHQLAMVDVAVYDRDGARVAAAGDSPPAALDDAERRAVRRGRVFHRGLRVVAAVELGGGGELVLSWSATRALAHLATSLLVILVVVALAAVPLTRAITRPLDRIAATARALGQGDLSARTGLDRRDEVGRLARVLDEMAARLEHTVKAEKELWANISHELRTPLSRIRVALELSAEEQEVGAVRRHLAGIDADMAELERLLDDVLTSARLDLANGGAGLVPRTEPLELGALCEEARRRLADRHPDRTVELSVEGEPRVEADQALLLRVLGNLLENAVKYSERDTLIELAAGAGLEGEVWVEVRDRGIGVEPADLPRLFEHFFRTDRSRSRGTGGTGLGLTLCRRVVEAHGGRIEALARQRQGLTVRFTLPVHTS